MRVYAVIDTNVIVSALLARNPQSATVKVLEAFWQGKIVPLVNDEIIDETRYCVAPSSDFMKSLWLLSLRASSKVPSVLSA